MKYYKLIQNNKIIGAISSENFIYFSTITKGYLRCTESRGEYISYKGSLYRTEWMNPIVKQEEYILVLTENISKEEYDILNEAVENNEEIKYMSPQEPPVEPISYSESIDSITIDFVRTSKIKEMSYTCNKTIEAGFDITLNNEIHHFSLTVQDQLNLISLSSMAAQGIQQIPYHADGELCKYYTPEEINTIVNQATYFKTYHTTYFNGLKAYINSLETIEEISAITYETPLPEEYQTDVWKQLNQ